MPLNRYENISSINQHFIDPADGSVTTVVPGSTGLGDEKSSIARSRFTKLVAENVDAEQVRQQEVKIAAPKHENTNPTNTTPSEADQLNATVLTDEFDGANGRGAVNTSAAPSELNSELGAAVAKAAEEVRKQEGGDEDVPRSSSTPDVVEKGRNQQRKK